MRFGKFLNIGVPALWFCLAAPSHAMAGLISYSFEATVTDSLVVGTFFTKEVDVGDIVTGSFTYDPNVPPDLCCRFSQDGIVGAQFTISSGVFSTSIAQPPPNPPNVILMSLDFIDDVSTGTQRDSFAYSAERIEPFGIERERISIFGTDDDGTNFSSNDPGSLIPETGWEIFELQYRITHGFLGDALVWGADITSLQLAPPDAVVPVPASFWFMLSGLLGLMCFTRRRTTMRS